MEKWSKYCLRLLWVLMLFSCSEKDFSNLTLEERKVLSKELWNSENEKHGFDHFFQGTPIGQTLTNRIITLDSTNANALRDRSVPFLKRGIPHKWNPYFSQVVRNDSITWQPWRGYLYLWFYRDYKKAIADFDASDTLTPNFIDAPQGHSVDYWRGIAYLGLKDYENSIAYFDKYIAKEIEESGEDWVELTTFLYKGIAHYEAGNFEEALKSFDKQLHYGRNLSADAKYYKALIYKEKGEIELSKTTINSAISDFNNGYNNKRPYVEALRQIYIEDLEDLKKSL